MNADAAFVFRSKQGLEEWRNQTKLKQLEAARNQEPLPGITESAPYATRIPAKPDVPPMEEEEDAVALHYKLGAGLDHHKVQKYKTRLEEKRKQVGIIQHPSSELQQAEKCLAEVICHIDKFANVNMYLHVSRPWPCKRNSRPGRQRNTG